jgi:type IV secretory pathway TrbF-like protein
MRFSPKKVEKGLPPRGCGIMAIKIAWRAPMTHETNETGVLHATGFVEDLRRVQEASAEEMQRIRRVYREIERRDGAAHWHAALWFRFACVLAVVLMVAIGANVVLAVKASRVQAFVQPVQITDEGKMVLVGIPKDLLDYQPDDSQVMDMLAQWVTKRRWKGDDSEYKRTRNDWAWLYRHSCGAASTQLAHDEAMEQPFKPSKVHASIEIKSITKTATPESFQVTWHEVTVDKGAATLKEADYIGTFTLGRIRPKTLTDAMDNRLGLCTNGYDISPALAASR